MKNSYLFSLDKFKGEPGTYSYIPDSDLYVIDGEFKGGPTRFINHSCDPNLRIYAVSFSRGNPRVHELAFFAIQDIEPNTELTFHYRDGTSEDAEEGSENKTRCLCGSIKCGGYLW